jgi:hypothetical protein
MADYYFQKEMIRLFSSDVVKYECERRKLHPPEKKITPACIYGEISALDLRLLLPAAPTGILRDVTYKLTSLSELKRFLEWDVTENDNYSPYWDCNKYAMQLMVNAQRWTPGLCLGMMDTPPPTPDAAGHAKNIAVTYDHAIYEIDPQARTNIVLLHSPLTLYWI